MFNVTFNLSQRTKGVTQCLLLIINIHDLYIFTSNFFLLLLLQQDFSRPTSKDESLKSFFAADGGCSSLSLSFPLALKIGFLAKQS